MQTVNVWHEDRWRQHKEKEVADQEIRTPQGEFNDLHYQFTCRLRHDVVAKAAPVPPACPPCSVGFVMFELARQEHGDQDLVDSTLNRDNRNETKNGMRRVPGFQEPLQKWLAFGRTNKWRGTNKELKEPKHSDNTENVRDGSYQRSKSRERGIHHGSEEQRNEEQHKEHRGVPDNGPEGDDGDANQWARR